MNLLKIAVEMIMSILAVIGVCSVVFELLRVSARRHIQSQISLVVKMNGAKSTEGQLRSLLDSGIAEDFQFNRIVVISDDLVADDEEVLGRFAIGDDRIGLGSKEDVLDNLF